MRLRSPFRRPFPIFSIIAIPLSVVLWILSFSTIIARLGPTLSFAVFQGRLDIRWNQVVSQGGYLIELGLAYEQLFLEDPDDYHHITTSHVFDLARATAEWRFHCASLTALKSEQFWKLERIGLNRPRYDVSTEDLGWLMPGATARYYQIVIPSLWILGPVAAIAFWRIVVCLRRRPLLGHCSACGYNLTGNTSGICPECGVAIGRLDEPQPAIDPR